MEYKIPDNMKQTKANLAWLSNPEIFRVNRMDAHSDHCFYETKEEAYRHAYQRNFLEDDMELHQSLNGIWKFHYSQNPNLRPADFYQMDYDVSGFDDIRVPGNIQMQGYDEPMYVNVQYPWEGRESLEIGEVSETENPTCSYVTYFHIKEKLKDKRIFLSFQGVETACYVWLNGHFIGYSEDSFTPSEFEVTEYLQEKNKLCVEVYKRSTGCWLEDQDFWRFSGIFRDVYLYGIPKSHLKDCFVTTKIKDNRKDASIMLEGCIEGAIDGSFSCWIEDGYKNKIGQVKGNIADNIQIEFLLPDAKQWSSEDPYLYQMFLGLWDTQGELVEVVPLSVGVREFYMENKVMKLNGERILFHGVNRHEFSGYTGRTVSRKEMLWDVEFLKKNNINAVRTSHYPNHSLWYELCDTYGIYLIDETNLETHGTWGEQKDSIASALPGDKPKWRRAVLDRAKNMLERDKNHPCVLIWSCGNESFGGSNLYAMSQFFHQRDCTRLVHYEGIFNDRRYPDTSDMESTMYEKTEEIRDYLENQPQKPYISCEYMHAMGNSLGGMKLYMDLEQEYPMYQGGFIWDYLDQAIITTDAQGKRHFGYGGDFDDRPNDGNFSGNGILFADRTYTPKVSEVKKLYQMFLIVPDKEKVTIENFMPFSNANIYDWQVCVYQNGLPVCTKNLDVSIEPHEKKEISYPCAFDTTKGECTIVVKALLHSDTGWEKAGYEIAFGEFICKGESDTVHGNEKEKTKINSPLVFAKGLFSLGVSGDGFKILFDRRIGLTSIKYGNIEYMKEPMRPIYYRALTDNDKGNGSNFQWAMFEAASRFQKCLGMESAVEDHGCVRVEFSYQMWSGRPEIVKVNYKVDTKGEVEVSAIYPGVKGVETIPAFGMAFKLPVAMRNYRYYGYGPDENYIDRNNGQKMGIYEADAKESMTPYLCPQACGNHTGTRWLSISDHGYSGIEISAVEHPFEFSVLPHSQFEIDHALHQEELPSMHGVHVNILAAQMGVGGEDSWGAMPKKQFWIQAENEMTCKFVIKRM